MTHTRRLANRPACQGRAHAMCEIHCTQNDGWLCILIDLPAQNKQVQHICCCFAAASFWIASHVVVVKLQRQTSCAWNKTNINRWWLWVELPMLLFHHVRRWQNVLSPFAISLVDSTFDPSVRPMFVYQNWVKGVHGVLEHVCSVTERVRRERVSEHGKYCATASDSEVDSLNSEHKQKELQSNMGVCSSSNIDLSV